MSRRGKGPSTMNTMNSKTNTIGTQDDTVKKRKMKKKGPYEPGSIFEGKVNYCIVGLIRNPGPHAEYVVKEVDKEEEKVMKLEPAGRVKMKYISEVLKKTQRTLEFCGHSRLYLIELVEYGTNTALNTNFMITTGFGIQLAEVHKILKKKMTEGCVLNIGLQTLECIRALHSIGYINRNIKPATFSIGMGKNEHLIVMSDYRLTRFHVDEKTKEPREPRTKLAFVGTARYATVDALKHIDVGRKDDIESWIYMLYDLYDYEYGLSWKYMNREKGLAEKEKFKKHALTTVYKNVPEEFKKLIDHVNSLEYKLPPDYTYLKEILEGVGKELKLDTTTVDWSNKLTGDTTMDTAVNDGATNNKSVDLICEGKDDFENPDAKPKAPRKLMNPNDTIKNGQSVWKVVELLGSGGFGDVYKVFNANGTKNKQYALKTESEDGTKTMLRLKVEMQVMMAVQEYRKSLKDEKKSKTDLTCNLKHFVEFVDRGKSEDLKCKFIVMSLVGPSLDDCRKKYRVDLSDKCTPWIIGVQSLEALRDMHTLGYLHRDIKPANYAVGVGADEHIVYLLDFGICRSFLDPKTKKHRAPRKAVKFLGTLRFASRACMRTLDQGRKDDLECWLYMMFDILDPSRGLLWRNMRDRELILAAKDAFFAFKLECYENITRKMKQLVTYIKELEYQSLPDYQFIINKLNKFAEYLSCPIQNPKKVAWAGKLKSIPKDDRFNSESSRSDDRGSTSGGD